MRGRQVRADVVNCVKQMSNFVHIKLTSSCWERRGPLPLAASGSSSLKSTCCFHESVMHPQGPENASPLWHRLHRSKEPILPGILFSHSNAPVGCQHHCCCGHSCCRAGLLQREDGEEDAPEVLASYSAYLSWQQKRLMKGWDDGSVDKVPVVKQ